MNFLQEWEEEILQKSSCKKPKPITLKVYELIDWSKRDPKGFYEHSLKMGWFIMPEVSDKENYMRWGYMQYFYRIKIKNEYVEPIREQVKADEKGQTELF